MPEENIVQMPTPIERLVMQVKMDLALCKEGRRDVRAGRAKWNAGVLALCEHLAKIREMFTADQEFGRYIRANGLSEMVLSEHDRRAAIGMGQDLATLEMVLSKTARWSIQTIYQYEFRFANVSEPTEEQPSDDVDTDRFANQQQAATQAAIKQNAKMQTQQATKTKRATPRPHKPPKVAKVKNPIPPKVREALKVHDAMDAAGKEINRQTLAAEANVSVGTASRAIIQRQLEQQAKGAPAAPPNPSNFSLTMKEQYERAVRLARQQIRAELETEIDAAIRKKWDESIMPSYRKKLELSEAIAKHHRGVMPKADYTAILKCLHPDRMKSITETELAEAFRIFTKLKPVLVKAEAEELAPLTMPRNSADLMTGRWGRRK